MSVYVMIRLSQSNSNGDNIHYNNFINNKETKECEPLTK